MNSYEGSQLYILSELDEANKPVSPIKVGITSGTKKRRQSLQTGNPRKIHVYKTKEFEEGEAYKVEQRVKRFLESQNLNTDGGKEWFAITPEKASELVEYFSIDWWLTLSPELKKSHGLMDLFLFYLMDIKEAHYKWNIKEKKLYEVIQKALDEFQSMDINANTYCYETDVEPWGPAYSPRYFHWLKMNGITFRKNKTEIEMCICYSNETVDRHWFELSGRGHNWIDLWKNISGVYEDLLCVHSHTKRRGNGALVIPYNLIPRKDNILWCHILCGQLEEQAQERREAVHGRKIHKQIMSELKTNETANSE